MRGARTAAALLAVAVAAAGCYYYPTVVDAGGTRLRPEHGRAVRRGETVAVFFDLNSTGKFGDVLTGVAAPLARQARVVGAGGGALARLEIPGATTVSFTSDGPHVVLSELTRPLVAGESIIVTLLFEKSGGIGVITLVE
ncbi:MAG TPA: copper chaperone PCu(A)C [Methylomirabilota bacterium]|nr:copper chaperone PCu(A)C [Methylomirabilota bacterium]